MLRLASHLCAVLFEDAVKTVFYLDFSAPCDLLRDIVPLRAALLPQREDQVILLQPPLVAADRWVDSVDPALSALARSAIRVVFGVTLVKLLSDARPLSRLAVTVLCLWVDLGGHISQNFCLLSCPARLLAALLLDEQPAL